MSEDRPTLEADAAAGGEPSRDEAALETAPDAAPETAPDAAPAPTPDELARQRARRITVLTVAAVLVIGTAIWIASTQRRSSGGVTPGGGSGAASGAAIRAPGAPALDEDAPGLRLRGTVVDGAGAAVAGAEVSAERERGEVDRALAGDGADSGTGSGSAATPAVRVGSGAGSGSAATPAVHVSAATGPDGGFAIAGLEPGRYRLRVTGPGLLPAQVRFVPVPSDAVQILVARQVTIAGTVVDGATPVPHAYVGLRGEAIGGTLEARTDGKGAFAFPALPEGRYQVFAWQGALAARAVRVNRLGAGPFAPVELRLEGGAIVVGRVLDRAEGTGVVAAVELRPLADDQPPRYARSGDDGVFRIEGVPHGAWIADAYAPGYTSPGGIELAAGRGIPELALIRGGTIEGRVLDGDGQPIAGASVRALVGGATGHELSAAVERDRLRRFSGRMSAPPPVTAAFTADPTFIPRGELGVTVGPIPPIPPPGVAAARTAAIDPAASALLGEPEPLPIEPARASIWTTGPDGRYRIRGVGRGKLVVLATAPGFAEGRSRQVTAEVGRYVDDVDVVLSAGTRLVGKVTDPRGTPVVGAQVRARPELGAPLDTFTDADGMYALPPVTGAVDLVATAYGHGDARRHLDLAPARGVQPAEQREDLVLSVADAILAGTLDDATGAVVAGATVEIVGGSGDGRRAITGDDGTFAIDMLADGAHRVRVTHVDYPPAELPARATTAARERVRLRLPLGGLVEGVLLDTGGAPLPGIAIGADGPGTATAETTTATDGTWKLGPVVPGTWTLSIAQPGFLPLQRVLDVPVSRAPGATSLRDIRLDLARGALLGGTVRDARGARAAGAAVVAQAADGTGPTCTATTDGEGEFRIRDCPTGDLAITATKADARGATTATIRAGDEVLGLAIELR